MRTYKGQRTWRRAELGKRGYPNAATAIDPKTTISGLAEQLTLANNLDNEEEEEVVEPAPAAMRVMPAIEEARSVQK